MCASELEAAEENLQFKGRDDALRGELVAPM